MLTIRYRLKPQSSFITDWSSDTIWGCLAWALARRKGDQAVTNLIASCIHNDPPFIVSDAFPCDFFPRPLIPMPRQEITSLTLDRILQAKKQKKTRWLPPSQFHAARNLEAYEVPIVESPFVHELTLHNQINRLTHTTADEGLLYAQEETWLNTKAYPYLSVYARVKPDWLDTVNQLMEDMGQAGIGARASTGKGVFTVQTVEDFSFPSISEANGVLVLSTYVPTCEENTYGFYKTKVKRGRLGGDYANRANPFKKPLITITPGSAFYGSPDKPFLGRIVPSIVPTEKHVVQCGLAFTLPAKLPPLDLDRR